LINQQIRAKILVLTEVTTRISITFFEKYQSTESLRAARPVTENLDLICLENRNLIETTGFSSSRGENMAAKKKTASAKSSGVATATRKAPAKATAKKKATATAKKKVVAKKPVSRKKAAAKTVTSNTDETGSIETAQKAPARKATAKKAVAKKAVAKKAPAKRKSGSTDNGQFKTFEPYQLTRGEEYMNEDQTEHFRSILQNWKLSLMEEVDRTVGHMKSDATNFPDPNDRATQEEEFSLELRTRDRERKLIKKIEESMTKLDEEEYGYCDGCGVEIGIRRLEARPTANMCIECKTLEEIREKQIA